VAPLSIRYFDFAYLSQFGIFLHEISTACALNIRILFGKFSDYIFEYTIGERAEIAAWYELYKITENDGRHV